MSDTSDKDDKGPPPSAVNNAISELLAQTTIHDVPIHRVVLGNDNQLNIPNDQAAIFTANGGHEIRFVARAGDRTDMMRFLRACYVRAEEDPGWWEGMVGWLDEYEDRYGVR